MLRQRTFVAVGLLAVVGGAVAYTRTRRDPHAKQAGGSAAGAPVIKAADVDEVQITDTGKPKVVLKKDASGWNLVEPVADRADQKNVEAALATLEKMKWKGVVAESKASWDKLQIGDDKALRVVLLAHGKPLETLLLGKAGNVRLDGEERVWGVTDLNRFALAREPKMWRERDLLRLDKAQIDRIEVTTDAGVKVAAHYVPAPKPSDADKEKKPPPPPVPDHWVLTEGAAAVGGELDEAVPGNIAAQVVRLDASDFGDGATPESAGLVTPRATVTVVMLDGTSQVLQLGKDDGQDVFVKKPAGARIWKIRKANAENMLKAPLQWRDKTLAKLDPKGVTRVDVVAGAEHMTFERVDDQTWKATAPADLNKELDSFKVQGLAAGFANLRAASIVAPATANDPKADPKQQAKTLGFDKPAAVVSMTIKGGATTVLTVGALVDKQYYLKISGRPEVFQIQEMGAKRFIKTPADFKKTAAPPPGPGGGMPPGHGGRPPGAPMPSPH